MGYAEHTNFYFKLYKYIYIIIRHGLHRIHGL